jgi:hypothetical protein
MQSDPHPAHDECPELRSVGTLKPGEMRASGNLNLARSCTYHDNEHEEDVKMMGTIIIR